jgi:hypothetical protein
VIWLVTFLVVTLALGIDVRIAAAGLIVPGALAVFVGVYSDPMTTGSESMPMMSGVGTGWSVSSGNRLPPLDAETAGTMMDEDDALYAGGAVLIALGIGFALLT